MEFENIDYDHLNTQSQLNDTFSQFMYDNSHQMSSFFQPATEKYDFVPEETIENHPISHYDTNGFNNSGLLSSEHDSDPLNFVNYENHQETLYHDVSNLATRIALSHACHKAEDYSNQMSSSQFEKYISTGDSSVSYANTLAGTPCMDHAYNMNSPMENSTPAVSTPNASAKGENQNAKRNMPVLFVQRVVKSFLDCFGASYNGSYGRLDYVYSILNMRVAQKDRAAFKEFLKSMDFGNKRTWSVIQEKLHGKRREFIDALLEGIDSFLSESGATDFHIWVGENKKMKGETKRILLESKDFFKDSFRSRFGGPVPENFFNMDLGLNMNF